jgi:phage shock protein A
MRFHCAPSISQIQLDAQRKALDQLQGNVRVLESKLTEARNKRETLKARAASAKSSKQIQEVREEDQGFVREQ